VAAGVPTEAPTEVIDLGDDLPSFGFTEELELDPPSGPIDPPLELPMPENDDEPDSDLLSLPEPEPDSDTYPTIVPPEIDPSDMEDALEDQPDDGSDVGTDPGAADPLGAPIASTLAMDSRYFTLSPIGMGDTGVFERVFDQTIGRFVVRKTIHLELADDPASVQRFLHEAETIAKLGHGAIVPVYDMGEFPDGRMWYTMRELRGSDLWSRIQASRGRDGRDPRRELLEVCGRICAAVIYAHEQGFSHGDIRPERVLVSEFSDSFLIGWGRSRRADVDAVSADIAAIGELLYAVITGERPDRHGDWIDRAHGEASWREVLEVARRSALSADGGGYGDAVELADALRDALWTQAEAPPAAGALIARPRAELERVESPRQIPPYHTVVVPEDRAGRSGNALVPAAQLPPVDPRPEPKPRAEPKPAPLPPSPPPVDLPAERTATERQLINALFAAGVVTILALLFGGWQANKNKTTSDATLSASDERDDLQKELGAARSGEAEARKQASSRRRLLISVVGEKARNALHEGDRMTAALLSAQVLSWQESGQASGNAALQTDLRGVALAAVSSRVPEPLWQSPSAADCGELDWSATHLACFSPKRLFVWGADGGKPRSVDLGKDPARSLRLSDDGSVLVTGHASGTLKVWDTAKMTASSTQVSREAVVGVDFTGPRQIVLGTQGGQLQIRSLDDGATHTWHSEAPISDLVVTGSDVLIVTTTDGPFQRWRLSSRSLLGEPIGMGSQGTRLSAAELSRDYVTFSPGNPDDRRVHFWSSKRPHQQYETEPMAGEVAAAVLSSDGQILASADRSGGVDLWERRGRRALTRIVTGTEDSVVDMTFSPEADRLAALTASGLLRVWGLGTPGSMQGELWGHVGEIQSLEYSDTGTLLSAGADGHIATWNVQQMSGAGPWHTIGETPVRDFAVGPKQGRLLAALSEGTLHSYDTQTGLPLRVVQLDGEPAGVLATPDWKTAVVWTRSGLLSLFDIATLNRREMKDAAPADVQNAALSPDGRLLAWTTAIGGVKVWRLAAQSAVTEWAPESPPSGSPAFSKSGKWLAVGSADGTLTITSTENWQEVRRLKASDRAIHAVVFTPDGKRLISAGGERVLRVWDTQTWQREASVPIRHGSIRRLALSDDGRYLAGLAQSGGIPVWDLQLLEPAGGKLLTDLSRLWGVKLQAEVMGVTQDPTWKP